MERFELSPVSNFFHLKEFFPQELFSLIDRLPFTTEGYTGAKNILVKKYGKHRLVAKAYVQNMSLPHINNSNPYKIHEDSRNYGKT